FHAFGNHDFLGDLGVDRRDIVCARAVVKDPHYCGMGAVDGADYAPLGAAVRADILDVDQDLVSMHRIADLVRGNENVSSQLRSQGRRECLCIRDHEAEAVAVHAQAPCYQILVGRSLRQSVAVGVDWDQGSAFHQLLQMNVQFPALLSVQAQFADELLVSCLPLGLAGNVLENGVLGEHEGKTDSLG